MIKAFLLALLVLSVTCEVISAGNDTATNQTTDFSVAQINLMASNAYAHLHPLQNSSYIHSEEWEQFRGAYYILIAISHAYIDFWNYTILEVRKIQDPLVLDFIFVLEEPTTGYIYVVRVEQGADGSQSAVPLHFNSATAASNEFQAEAVAKAIEAKPELADATIVSVEHPDDSTDAVLVTFELNGTDTIARYEVVNGNGTVTFPSSSA